MGKLQIFLLFLWIISTHCWFLNFSPAETFQLHVIPDVHFWLGCLCFWGIAEEIFGQAGWLIPIILALCKANLYGFFEHKISKPTWGHDVTPSLQKWTNTKKNFHGMWWYVPVVPASQRLRQEIALALEMVIAVGFDLATVHQHGWQPISKKKQYFFHINNLEIFQSLFFVISEFQVVDFRL